MAYEQTAIRTANLSDALASDINNLRAELKAAAMAMLLSSTVTVAIAYNANGTVNTITAVDAEGDANLDLDFVATYAYNADGTVNTITTVFSSLGKTLTETFGYTGGKVTSVTPVIS